MVKRYGHLSSWHRTLMDLDCHTPCWTAAAAAAKSLQSCPTLWDSTDSSPLGSSVPGILQARTLEWVAISFSNAWKWKVKVKSLSHIRLLATPWTTAYQAPPSMGFSRQEYWGGLPFPSPMHACMLSHFSHVQLCATPWTAAYQAPVSKGFSRHEYWSGLPFPSRLAGQLCLNLVFHNQIRSWSIYVAKVLSKLELNSEQSHFTDDM